MKATSLIAAALLAFSPLGRALEDAGTRPGLSLLEFDKFRADGVPDEQWPLVLEALGQKDQAKVVRSLVREMKPFPAKKLTALLTHPLLAVRLGALELLEEAAGEDFGFDPWREEPASGGNPGALARWQAWVEKGTPAAQPEAALTDDTFRAAAIEIMSGDRARGERGMQRMEAFGIEAVARIENFLQAQSSLELGPRAQLKGAQYRLLLLTALPRQASALARDLALGTLEQQSSALGALGDGGSAALPILAEFLTASDPLVRETAVDSAFKAGGAHAVPLILARLDAKLASDDPNIEHTESVLHSMLRGLGKNGGDAKSAETITGYLEHPSENVVITALEALAVNTKGDASAQLAARLDDPRWRVRATALETIGKRGSKGLEKQIEARLDDADSFVRISAVSALAGETSGHRFDSDGDDGDADAGNDLMQKLTPFFLRYDDLKPPILKLYVSSSATAPSAEMTDALWKTPPETLLLALDLFDNRDETFGGNEKRGPWKTGFVAKFATHPNSDVAAAALRILAEHGRFTAQLLAALQGTDQTRLDAVLDVLALPARVQISHGATTAQNPALDQLYGAFTNSPDKPKPGATPSETHAPPAEMRAVLEKFLRAGSPRQQFAAGCVLLAQSHEEAAKKLLASYDTLSALDCRRVASSLAPAAPWSDGPFLELARRVLRHPAGEVRETGIAVWLHSAKAAGIAALLDEFSRPGSLLEPDDIYDYYLHRILAESTARPPVLAWAKKILASDAAPGRKVFAMVLLGQTRQARGQGIERYLDDANPVLRRAAFRALGRTAVEPRLDALLKDSEAIVRAVIPFVAAPHDGWTHWFDDAHSAEDGEEFGRSRRFGSSQKFGAWATGEPSDQSAVDLVPAVEKLANDPADSVRFQAQFALLRLGRPIEPAGFAALLAAQNEESTRARYRVKSWLTENYARLGKGYAAIVPVLGIDGDDTSEKKVLSHFGLDGEKSPFTSFEAIAALAPSAKKDADNTIAAPVPETAPTGQPFRVLFFYKPGCRDCERVRDQLNRHAAAFPQMTLEERNIESPGEALLNETLSSRLGIKDTLHQVAPAVFTQAGALVRDDLNFSTLGTLLRDAATLAPNPGWAEVAQPEIASAKQRITQRYEALDRSVVATAGLLDGINPCAFATIIFLLSYLQVARRTPREILAVGVAFICAVFLAYFLVGLGLVQVLEKLAAYRIAGNLLNYALAALAVVIAALSFRDARLAADGRLHDMTLQLPGFLKDQIRTVIRTGARARNFVAAAFAAGIVISLLELACTGQVYLPTIQFMLRSGQSDALGLLLLYNSAFIIPLVAIFILAWAGMRSDALIAFQKKHTALAKVLTGAFFLALALFLIFGHEWLAALGPARPAVGAALSRDG